MAATNGTGWATRKGLEALKHTFNWVWGGTESLKGAENRRIRGNYLPWDGMLYRKSRTQRRARSRNFLLHCFSNTSIKHFIYSSLDVVKISFVMLSMVVVEIQTPDLIKKRRNFPFSAPHKSTRLWVLDAFCGKNHVQHLNFIFISASLLWRF